MQTMALILIIGAAFFLFVYFMKQVSVGFGARYDFTEEEIALGEHCIYRFQRVQPNPLNDILAKRLGNTLDDRLVLSIRDIDLGELQPDGKRQMTVVYHIDRIGETVGPAKQAIGTLVNEDCSVNLTVFQR